MFLVNAISHTLSIIIIFKQKTFFQLHNKLYDKLCNTVNDLIELSTVDKLLCCKELIPSKAGEKRTRD